MKPKISREQIKFIEADMLREIRLAQLSEKKIYRILAKIFNLPLGGGNFMCALSLLCYTEALGKEFDSTGKMGSRANFNHFFNMLGPQYTELSKKYNVYDIFRCGLAHQYWLKRDGTIYMFGEKTPALGFTKNGRCYFVVDQYYRDFMDAITREFEIV